MVYVLPFSVFELEDSDYCNHDFVEVREGGEAGEVLGRYCGNTLPSNMTTGYDLWIKFRTSPTVQGRGFMADYSFRTLSGSQSPLWLTYIAGLGFGLGFRLGLLYYAEISHWFGFGLQSPD